MAIGEGRERNPADQVCYIPEIVRTLKDSI
jgi:hypothetical protein